MMRVHPLTLVLLLATTAAVADEPAPKDEATLEPIIVNPRADPFDDSMQRLRKSMEDPDCRGCPPELQAYRKSPMEQIGEVIGFLTNLSLEPPQISPAQRVEERVRNDWKKAEWGPEMDDFK